jgi:hypothetical protein
MAVLSKIYGNLEEVSINIWECVSNSLRYFEIASPALGRIAMTTQSKDDDLTNSIKRG